MSNISYNISDNYEKELRRRRCFNCVISFGFISLVLGISFILLDLALCMLIMKCTDPMDLIFTIVGCIATIIGLIFGLIPKLIQIIQNCNKKPNFEILD